MPGKFSLLGRSRSTKTKSPLTSASSSSRGRKDTSIFSSSSKSSRPKSSHGTSSGGFLKPSSPGSSNRRSRSHETPDRRSRPPVTSTGRDVYDRPGGSSRRDSRLRSVSPRPRPLPPSRSFRAPRPRPRRDSSISEDDSSRPLSRRHSLSPSRVHGERIPRPSQDIRRPSLSPPRNPLDHLSHQEPRRSSYQGPIWPSSSSSAPRIRPTAPPYASNQYRPRPSGGSRTPSYNSIPQVLHQAAGGSRASTPPKYRPQVLENVDVNRTTTRPKPRDDGSTASRKNHGASNERLVRPEYVSKPHHATQREHPSKPDHESRFERPPTGPKTEHAAKPSSKPTSQSPPKSPSKGATSLFKKIPEALVAYGGLEALSEHVDTAKGWADWLNQIRDAPEEMHSLTAKVQTARDTITQIQNTLEARPDLVEGDSGQRLRSQIETAIKSTNAVLTDMTKVLQDLSETPAEDGSIMSGVQEFYNSYKYRNEWEHKIKEADGELQKELGGLSTLMINLYSRSLMKPAPLASNVPVPPPAPIASSIESAKANHPPSLVNEKKSAPVPVASEAPIPASTSSGAHLDGLDPPPIPQLPKEFHQAPAAPPTPSTLGEEEANIGTGANPTIPQPISTDATLPHSTTPPLDAKNEPAVEPKPEKKKSEVDPKEALLDAAWYGDLEATAEALRHAPVTIRDKKDLTPLHLAAERDNLAIAMLLLDHHADSNARDNGGRTPLHLASRFASAATVEVLVEDGRADPNARTTDSRTPLHYAASSAEDGDEERREVVRVLRDWGADPTAEDAKGRTPRDVAQKRDYWDISSTLRRAEKRWEDDHRQGWFKKHGFRK